LKKTPVNENLFLPIRIWLRLGLDLPGKRVLIIDGDVARGVFSEFLELIEKRIH
jgi:hypothetical protein